MLLLKTLDAEAGLVNGARGVVTRFLATRNPAVRFHNGVERSMRLEAYSRAGRALHDALPRPLPPPQRPLFYDDLERFDRRVTLQAQPELSPHYVPEEAQRGVMTLIDQLSLNLSAQRSAR